jgi:hypothetical protein
VLDAADIFRILQRGIQQRRTSATLMNKVATSILRCRIAQSTRQCVDVHLMCALMTRSAEFFALSLQLHFQALICVCPPLYVLCMCAVVTLRRTHFAVSPTALSSPDLCVSLCMCSVCALYVLSGDAPQNSSRSHSIFTLKIMIRESLPDGSEASAHTSHT